MKHLKFLFLLFLLFSSIIYSKIPEDNLVSYPTLSSKDLIINADKLYHGQKFSEAIKAYEQIQDVEEIDEINVLKKMALSHAALNDANKSVDYLEKYLMMDFKTSFMEHEGFLAIKNSPQFKNIVDKYAPKVSIWSFFYFYVALIGFFVVAVLNFNKKMDFGAKLLISGFVFIHSFFILHISINITNFHFQFPHSYLMSTSFSFLYGPLLYFYFKRITQEYKFKKSDALHLIPTILFLAYIIPVYSLPEAEKLQLMLQRANKGLNPSGFNLVAIIVSLKLISLLVYGYFIRNLYFKSKKAKELSKENRVWQKNIYSIHFLYILSYAIYGVLIVNHLSSGIVYHSQVVLMASMVLYVGYSANVQPTVFNGVYSNVNRLLFKYEKSGLTESLSGELKESLINLFDIGKIYRENDINLDILSKKLNTSRHNTSQVINEHFNMSFHELINRYRIQDAKNIMDRDHNKNLNIIDIAYEVGYNNKVTFNKAFKKDTLQTPSEYQKTIFLPQV
ncbi:MAG: AraC family transcriptional regulator [Flavobacteriaceae bacterium]|nr:MAG: AraC family transcriptional regulator [Flavobacteriaceae bacterium]